MKSSITARKVNSVNYYLSIYYYNTYGIKYMMDGAILTYTLCWF